MKLVTALVSCPSLSPSINLPYLFFNKFLKKLISVYFGCAGSPLLLSSDCNERGLVFISVQGLLIVGASLVEHGLQECGLQWLQHVGLVAPWQVGSSWTRDRTLVPCIGKQILNHWTTREALYLTFFFFFPC